MSSSREVESVRHSEVAPRRPLCIDLFCGLGGWAEGFLAEGYDVVGFDIERHDYGTGGYPGQLVLQDVLTLDGRQFRNAAVIVASPPCQGYSFRNMPWCRLMDELGPALGAWDDDGGSPRGPTCNVTVFNDLFNACFRIATEANRPVVIENVRGAQDWVGPPRWHFVSYYLWGDVPALMPIPFATKTTGHANKRDGHTHTRHLANQAESDGVKVPGMNWSDRTIKQHGSGAAWFDKALDERRKVGTKSGEQ